MIKIGKKELPPIGLRIIKSAVAVLFCYLISFLRGNQGIVFYSLLASLWCIQVYVENTKKNAIQRFIGTVVGAAYGLFYLLVRNRFVLEIGFNKAVDALFISMLVVITLYTTVLMKKKQASYFSCVVFLSIVVNHVTDANPYLFVWNRFLDTVIGIIVGVGVNTFSLPRAKRKDILFISGLDDTLLNSKYALSDYNRVELNRMLDDGMNFTISTMRTPASLIDPMRDIRLKLPVIAMDGAVLYDIREKTYLKIYVISPSGSERVMKLVSEHGLHCFTNVIIEDLLVIYHDDTDDEVQRKLVRELRRSPYRNYVARKLPEGEKVVYFMLLYPHDIMESFYHVLEKEGITESLKVVFYDSVDYPGYSYIKIYNRNATKDNMIHYLKEQLKIENTVTFGTIPGKYDIVVRPGDSETTVRRLRKLYEPVKFLAGKRKKA